MTFVHLLSAPTARRPSAFAEEYSFDVLVEPGKSTLSATHKSTPLDAFPEQKDGLPVIMGKAGGNHITDG